MKKTIKNKLSLLIVLLLTIIVLYFSLKDDFDSVIQELKSANILFLLIAVIMTISYYVLTSISMYVIIKKEADSE